MTDDQFAAIISNDLASLVHRIEALPACPAYTDAMRAVQEAKTSIDGGRAEMHQRGMRERFQACHDPRVLTA